MIIPLKKYLLWGLTQELEDFLTLAQEQGFIQFLTKRTRKTEYSQEIHTFGKALKILRKLPVVETFEGRYSLDRAKKIAENINALREEINALEEQKKIIEVEIARVTVFGDFSTHDIQFIEQNGHKKIQFFCRKSYETNDKELPENLIYIGTEYDLDYFIAINDRACQYPSMVEMLVPVSAPKLKKQLNDVEEKIHHKEAALKLKAQYTDYVRQGLYDLLNEHNYTQVKQGVDLPAGIAIFAVEVYVPETKIAAFKELLEKKSLNAEEIAIDKGEKIPTYMENQGLGKIGEDIIKIYDVPSTTDKDPSRWVLWSFIFFFSIIVADGGYGFLYLGLAVFLRYKFPSWKGFKKRFVQLLALISTGVILWGLLTSSFFGLEISPKSALSKISIVQRMAVQKAQYHIEHHDEVYLAIVDKHPEMVQQTDPEKFLLEGPPPTTESREKYEVLNDFCQSVMMELSLLIGVLHISLSFLRYVRRNYSAIGWVALLFGGYLFFPSMLNATSLVQYLGIMNAPLAHAVGLQLIYGGLGVALFLALIQKGWAGFGEIAHVVQVFADVLSYLRLYALSLAGTIVAETFNDIGSDVGLVVGFIIVLLGHGVNVLLGAQAGVIHGLRLNFIEWYHYSFEGGGVLFAPLKKLRAKETD